MNYLIDALYVCLGLGLLGLATPLVIYPALLFVASRFRTAYVPGQATPRATMIISAYNEAAVIREKIANALAQDYPAELLDVMVISDASDDGTDEIVRQFDSPRVRLYRQEQRLGKSAGLTRFCPEALGEILIFTDANSIFDPKATRKLLQSFDDHRIGYTVGLQFYTSPDDRHAAGSEEIYWSIEMWLKRWESRLSSVVGADGAIYAMRKSLFEPLLAEDINDFLLPLKAVAKGYRGILEPEAVCFEQATANLRSEFHRKYRIVNRSLLAVMKVPQSLNPFRVGVYAFQLLCHKVLRWLSPAFVAMTFVSAALLFLLDSHPVVVAICAAMATGLALASLYSIRVFRRFTIVNLAYYYLMVNVAAVWGILMLMVGRSISTWQPQRS